MTCKNTVNMGIRHYTNMRQWKLKPMEVRHTGIVRRRKVNVATAKDVPNRAITTAARLATEEDLANSATSPDFLSGAFTKIFFVTNTTI